MNDLTSPRTQRRELKREVLTHYGKGKCACVKCGHSVLTSLSLDHINDDGAVERKQFGLSGSGLYSRLRVLNFPSGYQTLCFNCNWEKENRRRVARAIASDERLARIPVQPKPYSADWNKLHNPHARYVTFD